MDTERQETVSTASIYAKSARAPLRDLLIDSITLILHALQFHLQFLIQPVLVAFELGSDGARRHSQHTRFSRLQHCHFSVRFYCIRYEFKPPRPYTRPRAHSTLSSSSITGYTMRYT